jgi:hypothetical protein
MQLLETSGCSAARAGALLLIGLSLMGCSAESGDAAVAHEPQRCDVEVTCVTSSRSSSET